MAALYANNASAILGASVTAVATSLTLETGQGERLSGPIRKRQREELAVEGNPLARQCLPHDCHVLSGLSLIHI